MKAILYKNFVSNKLSYILTQLIVLIIIIYALYKEMVILVPGAFLVLAVIINAMSEGVDLQCDFNKFMFTTPISRRDYVKSMYFIPIVLACLSFIVTGAYLLYSSDLKNTSILLYALLALAIPIIFSAIYVPLLIKYGADKGRVLMVISYMVIFGALQLISEKWETVQGSFEKLMNINPIVQILAILGITILVLYLSIRLSNRIELKKEF